MDKLSFELVEHIASYLDAGSALALSKVCKATREACLSRLSPERYLQSTFRNAKSLLAAMTDNSCVLSGSRALEYFVPGSIVESDDGIDSPSDWDFLVPCKKNSVIGMMDALEKCGVEWDQPLRSFAELLDKPVGTVVLVPTLGIMRNPPDSFIKDPHPFLSKETKRLYQRLYDWVEAEAIERSTHVAVKVVPPREKGGRNGIQFKEMSREDVATYSEYEADVYAGGVTTRPVCLINGSLKMDKKRVKVQLFQCHLVSDKACTPLEYIMSTYYASHVQCFIGGWCAGHFFFELARDKLALTWPLQLPAQRKAVARCVKKYGTRGFRFLHSENYDDQLVECFGFLNKEDTSPLDAEKARAVEKQGVDSSHLGEMGTLLLRYGRLQRQISRLNVLYTVHYNIRWLYRALQTSITQLQFTQDRGRPSVVEPIATNLTWQYQHEVRSAQILAEQAPADTPGVHRELTGFVDPGSPAWLRFDRYLRQSQLACVLEGCCESVSMYAPLQI